MIERQIFRVLKVYDWFAIQNELAKDMGIDPEDFRKGVDYWHIALDTIVPERMANDTIVTMYYVDTDADYYKNCDDNYKRLIDAWNKFFTEAVTDEDGVHLDNALYVEFSW